MGTYVAELYYLQDHKKTFPYRRAVKVTAQAVSRWCAYYYAKLLAPLSDRVRPRERAGRLPADPAERERFVGDLVDWIFANSVLDDLFVLFLDDRPVPRPRQMPKFDHPDDTCCWALNLNAEEFATLQAVWREHGLPEDLFYPPERTICVPYKGRAVGGKVLEALGFQKCYTPKQWEETTMDDGR